MLCSIGVLLVSGRPYGMPSSQGGCTIGADTRDGVRAREVAFLCFVLYTSINRGHELLLTQTLGFIR